MQRSILLSTGLLFALFGCDDTGRPTLDTGVPSDQSIGELDSDQSAQVCEGAVDLVNELAGPDRQAQIQCAIVGIATEIALQGECAPARDNCLEDGFTPGLALDLPCQLAPAIPFSGCEATIGQLEACVNDVAAGVDTVLDAVGCGLVDDPDVLPELAEQLHLALDPATHEACFGLAESCLAFLDLPSIDIDIDISIED
jgi:hypothetical protein